LSTLVSPVACRKGKGKKAIDDSKGKGKALDDPFDGQYVLHIDCLSSLMGPIVASKRMTKESVKESDTFLIDSVVVKPTDEELEDEDEIINDEPIALLDQQGSGLDDDGKPFVYQEDLHKRG
jgi:hypothetical protein